MESGVKSGRLRFSTNFSEVRQCEVVWVTYDTPVDDEDRADINFVLSKIDRLVPHLGQDALVVISSQLPVGTVAALEKKSRTEKIISGSGAFLNYKLFNVVKIRII